MAGPSRRLIYAVTEDWYFLSHRLPMARAARDAGFEVHVATNIGTGESAIVAEGFHVHPVSFARGNLSPKSALRTIRELRSVYGEVSPDIIHHVALQPSVLGSIAALGLSAACINAVTGFGFVFSSSTLRARLIRPFLRAAGRWLFKRQGTTALVQNSDDRDALMRLGVHPSRIALIPGSGVDVRRYIPLREPSGPITAGFSGRLLRDKGIHILMQAHQLLLARDIDIRLIVAGTPDPANPSTISEQELSLWKQEKGVTFLGHVNDITRLWRDCHIAVLPSRREGLPMALLEAAACGKPMVATDVPGCREIVIPGRTGILVPADSPQKLADAIATLSQSPALRDQYGVAARELAAELFSTDIVGREIVQLYRSVLDSTHFQSTIVRTGPR